MSMETGRMPDADERFVGVVRLHGVEGARRLAEAHVVVVGVGGVGSWAAEALCRSGVGRLTLVDPDAVCASNTNRQVEALEGGYGLPKVDVLAERFRRIAPGIRLTVRRATVTPEDPGRWIPKGAIVLDCIDDVPAKVALIAEAKARGQRVIVSGGAGGRVDPTRVFTADLSRVVGDGLLAAVRTRLRKTYGFPSGAGKRPAVFRVPAVYSDEPMRRDGSDAQASIGFGASVCVTATVGMTLAALAIREILEGGQDVRCDATR